MSARIWRVRALCCLSFEPGTWHSLWPWSWAPGESGREWFLCFCASRSLYYSLGFSRLISLFLFNCRICSPEGILPYCLSQSFSSLLFSQVSFCESDNSVIIIPPPHSSARESAHLMAWVGIAGVQSTAIFSLYVIMKFAKSLPTSNKPLLHMRSIAK